jgi:ribosome-associated toxin RatA of RatAB toxin-antitoxin module
MKRVTSIPPSFAILAGIFSFFKGTTLSLSARLIISAIALIVIFRNAHATSDLSESQLLQLKSGAVLVAVQQADEPSKGMVEATVLIDAPAESIWQVMVNCHEIPTFVPGLKACQVLMAGENWEIIRHEVKWMWLLPRLSYVFRAIYQPNRQIDFVKIEGDLREMKGTWRLTPLNETGQTIVRYSVYLDPGFFVPQWIVRQSLKADLPAILTALRTEVLESRTRNKP